MTKKKVQKYQERNLKKKNTKTQKTHGRKCQEDFKQKNTTYGNVFLCFFILLNIRLQRIERITLVNLTTTKKHKKT